MALGKIFTLLYEHKHGSDISLYFTKEGAEAGAAEIARTFWMDRADHSAPDDCSLMSDAEIIHAYFDNNEREFISIEPRSVVGEPDPL